MRTTLLPVHSRRAAWLYAGVAVFVLLTAFTARTVWEAWNQRAGQARTEAVFELVQQRMPSRPVEAPGAIAWLREQFARYPSQLPPIEARTFARLSLDADAVPDELLGAASAMRTVAVSPAAAAGLSLRTPVHGGTSRRAASLLTTDGSTIVITRRHALEDDPASNGFVARLAPAMTSATAALDDALRGVARPVRLYALAEDGTLVSQPWPSAVEPSVETARMEAFQLSARPSLPSFAPEEFFFRFVDGETEAVRYSGFYVDLGGRGLVSTLTMPIGPPGQAGVLALDLAHTIDWDHFASRIAPPLAATIVHTQPGRPETWISLRQSLSANTPAAIQTALAEMVGAAPERAALDPISHRVVPELGAIAAFHVSDRTWLLTFFPSTAPAFPGGAVALLGAVLAILLVGFEVNRRRAEREADRAAQALSEKQNLLNTMQVPLVVVDPNTDEIVSANQVAESIGIRRGARFSDRIARSPRARAHYERTQVATSGVRRAYGVPIRVETGSAEPVDQFALVRSVAVTAPIEALAADERHRLAILFLVDPASDLQLLLEDVEASAHTDERRRLAGLLSHGVDSLADVLRRTIVTDASASSSSAWLAEYLQRRLRVTAWLLDHWDAPPPPHDAVVDAGQARETLRSLEAIFTAVREDRQLRARLGWTNGPLSQPAAAPPFEAAIEWPEQFETTLPVRGGLGFFLTEVLSNAMRHGAATAPPRLAITCDQVRSELKFVVENDLREDRERRDSRYGGLALLTGMARLFGWREFAAVERDGRFVVSWVTALTRRDRPGRPD